VGDFGFAMPENFAKTQTYDTRLVSVAGLYEPGGMGLCATGHFAPKQNYKVLKNNNVN
jgi:hypothetical protein